MRWLVSFLVCVLLVILQTGLVRFFAIGRTIPDLAIIAVVFFSHHRGSYFGEWNGFVTGLAADLLSVAPLGFFTIVYSLIGYAAGKTQETVILDRLLFPAVLVLLALVIKHGAGALLLWFFAIETTAPALVSAPVLIEITSTVVLTPLMFWLLGKLSVVLNVRGASEHG